MVKKEKKPGSGNKKRMLFGMLFMFLSFVCLGGVFYFLVDAQIEKAEEIEYLSTQLDIVSSKAEVAERKAQEFKEEYGQSISLDKILEEAKNVHGKDEMHRKEGDLWIDRDSRTMVVTLGALHGLSVGSMLTIYDEDGKVGGVRVETALDVISYVKSIDKKVAQLEKDSYRVVLEK
ncbi:MAG: hypothetical protein KAR05_11120 [Candidatus Omnitrophica bacterium]|nr:hypothetical protein [Candidatus Omnitrophota bacterium]